MVAIAISVLVVGLCSVAILSVGLETDRPKRATTRRAGPRAARAGFTLVAFATGLGVAAAAVVGVVALAIGLALKSAVNV